MRAFVYALDNQGEDRLSTGRISPTYTHFGNFMRHWMQKLPPGRYRVYIYNGWARRHQQPDAIQVITVQPTEAPHA